MKILWRFAFRGWTSRPGRALLTLLSIVIGVAAVVSVIVSVNTTRESYKEIFASLTGRAALEIVPVATAPFPERDVLDAVADVKAVQTAVPSYQAGARVVRELNGERLRIIVQALGIDPTRDRAVRDYEVVEGRYFTKGDVDGVMLEAGFAQRLGLKVGDELFFEPPHRRSGHFVEKLPILGLLAPRGVAGFGLVPVIVMPLARAQEIFCPPGTVNVVSLVLDDSADPDVVIKQVTARLDELKNVAGVMVRAPGMRTQVARETMGSAENGLAMACGISVGLAAFIIINTFLMNTSERRRQISILRAVGATRGQILRVLLMEACVLGVLGTILGGFVGLAGAQFLATAMAKAYGTMTSHLNLGVGPFVLAAVLGPVLSLIAMVFPAITVWRISPLEGMRPAISPDSRGVSLSYSIISVLIFAFLISLLTATVFKVLPVGLAPYIGVALTLSFVLLVPLLLGLFSAVATVILGPILGPEGRIACRQILRRRIRATLTIGVLYVAIAVAISLGTSIINTVGSLHQWQDVTMVGDFLIQSMTASDISSGGVGTIDESIGDKIYEIRGVKRVDTIRLADGKVPLGQGKEGNQNVMIIMRDARGTEGDTVLNLMLQGGADPEDVKTRMAHGEVVVGTNLSQRLNLQAGDYLDLNVGGEEHRLRIAATITEYMVGGLVVHMDYSVGKQFLPAKGVNWYIVKANPDARQEVQEKLATLCNSAGLILRSTGEVRRRVEGMTSGVTGSLWGLLALSFVVSGFGVANTLTMNVLEQTRELALLRVVAASRWQVRKTILAQATMYGFLGLVAGLIGGAIGAYINSLCSLAVTGRAIPFIIYPSIFFISAAFALTVILVAAFFPAERAARLNLLIALQYE